MTTIRRTLDDPIEYRKLKVSELKVGFCVSLSDGKNTDSYFVKRITETELVFDNRSSREPKEVEIILTRDGDTLRDEKHRRITVSGRPTQYDYEGNQI